MGSKFKGLPVRGSGNRVQDVRPRLQGLKITNGC